MREPPAKGTKVRVLRHHFPKDYCFRFNREEIVPILTKTHEGEDARYVQQKVWFVDVSSKSHGEFETMIYPGEAVWDEAGTIVPDA